MRIVSGIYRGRVLKTTSGPGYRPATSKVRQALFSMLESRGVFWPDTRVVDVFAGSGSLGFEALSRGAECSWFIENNPEAARLIGQNAQALKVPHANYKVLDKDVFTAIGRGGKKAKAGSVKLSQPFDLAFIDPPYGKDLLLPAVEAMLDREWLSEDSMICAEVERGLDLDPDTVDPRLETLVDRTYGQTRILLWDVVDPDTQDD